MKVFAICHDCLFKVEMKKAIIMGRDIYHKNCYKRAILKVGTGKLELMAFISEKKESENL